ncbi:MAG: hypothetical protein Fues2KO_13510 [Fuerstiella sp.]
MVMGVRMMLQQRKQRSGSMAGPLTATLLLTAAALACVSGCSQNEPVALAAASTLEIPEAFDAAGERWVQKAELDESDQRCLHRYFSQNPALTGSAAVEGNPIVFTAGRSSRRFYWVQPGIQNPAWTCVSCVGGRFAMSDGRGDPFVHDAVESKP